MPENMTIHIERGQHGLWYVTSSDIKGLLVAERSFDDALLKTPSAIRDLERAASDQSSS